MFVYKCLTGMDLQSEIMQQMGQKGAPLLKIQAETILILYLWSTEEIVHVVWCICMHLLDWNRLTTWKTVTFWLHLQKGGPMTWNTESTICLELYQDMAG